MKMCMCKNIFRPTLNSNYKPKFGPPLNGRQGPVYTANPKAWFFMAWHDDVIKWKHFPRNWPFVRGIHRSPVNSPHKGQWRGALMFSLTCAWMNEWVNNREAGDLRRFLAHYDVTVMDTWKPSVWSSIVSIYNDNECSSIFTWNHRRLRRLSYIGIIYMYTCTLCFVPTFTN